MECSLKYAWEAEKTPGRSTRGQGLRSRRDERMQRCPVWRRGDGPGDGCLETRGADDEQASLSRSCGSQQLSLRGWGVGRAGRRQVHRDVQPREGRLAGGVDPREHPDEERRRGLGRENLRCGWMSPNLGVLLSSRGFRPFDQGLEGVAGHEPC